MNSPHWTLRPRSCVRAGLLLAACVLAFHGVGSSRAQNLRITEFLAVNTTGIQDEDMTPQGWIEIWNPSITAKVALNGLKLTDGTNRWIFPAVEIMPDERMLVWASGKDRRVLDAPLHTNFTISPAAGGKLQLLGSAATDLVLSQFDPLPVQVANVSYGRDEWDTATALPAVLVGSYSTPSPGERNNYSGPGVAGKVLIDTPSQAFLYNPTAVPPAPSGSPLTVTLSQVTPDPAAEIRYTLTGGATTPATPIGPVPTPASTLYAGPITVSSTQILRARVFKPGLLPGETETTAFLLLNEATANFSSSMPIIALTNFLNIPPPDTGEQTSFVWVWEPAAPDNRSRMTNLPTLTSRTIIDKRGSSTLGNAKFNLNMEMRKPRDDDDRNVSLLGMPVGADWVLGAPYSFDPSLLHNPLAYAMSNSIDRYAVRNRMAEVFIEVTRPTIPGATTPLTFTATSSGDYFGVYNVSEKVRRDKNRVDVVPLETYDNDPVSKTGGLIWKVDRVDSSEGDTGFSAGSQSFAYYYPKENQLKSPQRDPQEKGLSAYITSFNTALQGVNSTNPTTGYAPWLDVPAALDHHIVNTWTFNVDALRLSGYWHKQRSGKMVAGPVWDFDRALSSTDGRDSNPKVWKDPSGDGTDFFNYSWWNKLFRDPDFYQKWIDRWQALRRPGQPFSPATFNALIDSLNAEISDEAIFRDLARWRNTKRAWTSPFTGTVYPGESYTTSGANPTTIALAAEGQRAEVQRLKDYMQQRADFFDTEWVGPVTASLPEGNVPVGSTVTLSVPATPPAMAGATIYYTLNGSDPRPSWPTGGAAPTAGTLAYTGTPIVITGSTRLRARAYHPTWVPGTGVSRAGKPPLISKWSALTNLWYGTDPPAAVGNLVITEINFHPAGPTASELTVNPLFEDKNFEFVELRNVGTTPVDLFGLQLSGAVSFSFTGENAVSIPPGAQIVVASDPTALAARYGAVGTVLGPWTGDLSNAGETLTLTAANSSSVLSFTYDDEWFSAADGGGSTLVTYDPKVPAADFATVANWRASQAPNGSPGAYDPNSAPFLPGGSLAGPFTAVPLVGVLEGGHSNGPPTVAWTFLDGPGTATIDPNNALLSTAVFSLPGAYTLRLAATDNLQTATTEITVYAQETPAYWLAAHPGIGTLDDDFEGDGRSNFLEYALLTDPTVPDYAEPPIAGVRNGFLTLTFPRFSPPSSVQYTVQVSNDLLTYRAPNPGELIEEVIDDQGFTQTVRYTDTVPLGSQVARFLRIEAASVQ